MSICKFSSLYIIKRLFCFMMVVFKNVFAGKILRNWLAGATSIRHQRVHLYIGNLYITEAKEIFHKADVFIYYWGVLRIVHYGGIGEIIQKMTKFPSIRVPPPPTKSLFLPYKYLSPSLLLHEMKHESLKKVIKILSNKMNQFSACSPHFSDNKP